MQIHDLTIHLEQRLGDNKAACEGLSSVVILDASQNTLQIIQVIVVIPVDGRAGDLDAPLYGKVDTAVGHNDVASFGESSED